MTWVRRRFRLLLSECCQKNRKHKRDGGLALMHRSGLSFETLPTQREFIGFECLEVKCIKPVFQIFLIYHSLTGRGDKRGNISKFLDELLTLMTKLATAPGKVIGTGDFNIHQMNTTAEQYGRVVLHNTRFEQIVKQPTHRHGNTLDWVLIRPVDQIIAGEVLVQNNIKSDHHTITFKINGSQPRPLTHKTSYRNYCGLDTDSFQTDLAAAFDVVLKSDAHVDGEELLRQYNLNTTSVLDKHAPMVERNKRTRASQPWINDDILKIRQKRCALERQ